MELETAAKSGTVVACFDLYECAMQCEKCTMSSIVLCSRPDSCLGLVMNAIVKCRNGVSHLEPSMLVTEAASMLALVSQRPS